MANLVNIFNPGRIIIGGGMGIGLQDLLLPRIREYVYANVFSLHKRNLAIEATRGRRYSFTWMCGDGFAGIGLRGHSNNFKSEGNELYDC